MSPPPTAVADVAVIGAGPAGMAAAIALARSGRRVVAVDKARFPRDKCCGDGLTSAALRHIEDLGVTPAALRSWQALDGVMIRVPDGGEAHFPLPAGGVYAAVVRRRHLDAALVERARAEGVEVREGAALSAISGGDDQPLCVTTAEGAQVRAWYAVAADGAWSPTRKLLGAGRPGYLGDWHAARQYFSGTGPAARDMWVWFEPDLLPGYVWSFPLPGGAVNIGFGVHRRAGRAAPINKAGWEEILDRPHIRSVLGPGAEPEGPWRAWPIPAGIGAVPLSAMAGRVLFTGDAVRAGDSMTGEGIAQALETGRLAARAILAAGASRPERAAWTYGITVGAGLRVDDALAQALTRVLARRRGANGWMRIATATGFGHRHFGPWMFEHYPRALPLTPYRWGRGRVGGAGAFAAASGPPVPSVPWQTSASTAR